MGRRDAGINPLSPRHLALFAQVECDELLLEPFQTYFGLVSAPFIYCELVI